MSYLRKSWIVVLLLLLSACSIFNRDEPTPTAESESVADSAETETPTTPSPSPTKATTTPTLRATPAPTEAPDTQVRPLSNAIFIRSGPGDGFDTIALLNENETAVVIGTDDFGSWYQVLTADGEEGWVAASVVELIGEQITAAATSPATPRPQTTVEPGTIALRITINAAYIRSGPGQNYAVIDYISRGSTVAVIAYTGNGSWFNVRLADGSSGWVGDSVTEPGGDWTLDEISVASTIPAPPPTPQDGCDPAYPTICVPPSPPDLDCRDIPHRSFTVLPPDPHLFDGNGNGLGCEPIPTPTFSADD